jgi:soluble lytic murein transglycosylase-like protein
MKSIFCLLSAIICFSFASNSYGQALYSLYSYVDENGDRVFTNLAPVHSVAGMQVTGAQSTPALLPASASASKSENFDPIIERYASDYQIDPHLIRSIIAQESGFNPKAVSPKGARGLMQLMPATAARLGVRNSFDPEQNIQGGVKHFKFLMVSFNNNLELSLAAYNAGENLVQRLGRVPAIRETRDYVQSITRRYGKKEVASQTRDIPEHPPILQFVDETGTSFFTNIPPTR